MSERQSLFADAHRETERLLRGIEDAARDRRLASRRAVEAQEEADAAAHAEGRWEKAYQEHVAKMREKAYQEHVEKMKREARNG